MRSISVLGLLLGCAVAPPALAQTAPRTPPRADTLPPRPARLEALVVPAWRFGAAPGAESLSREEWENQPQPGEDVFRMVNRLPGVTSNDLSSRFAVRGGSNDELLVRLDGLELVEPFHLREIEGGGLSIVDMEALGGVELIPGGATAEYGNRLTGVFDMRTAAVPRDGSRTVAGLSLTNARFLAQRSFGGGRGDWLFTARRGFMDLVLNRVDEQVGAGNSIVPRYGDVMGKVRWSLGANHSVSLHALYAGDSFRARDNDLLARNDYANRYAWANWQARFGPALSAHTVASVGDLDWDRGGRWDGDRQGEWVTDRRSLRFAAVRQEWELRAASRFLARWGWNARRSSAEYDYANVQVAGLDGAVADSVSVSLRPAGDEWGAYLAGRVNPADALSLEAGVRYDRQSHTGDRTWSPRVNASLALGSATSLHAAWGIHHQAQGIHQLAVQSGDTAFGPAERAEQRTVGIEHTVGTVSLRADAYQRLLRDVRPRWVSLDRKLDVFPEVEDDRVLLSPSGGEARGVELFAQGGGEGAVRWWAGYALARIRDRYEADGAELPRDTDQRHTFRLGASYVPSPAWRVNAAWEFHTGVPITARSWTGGVDAEGNSWARSEFGALYGERLSAYHRMDLRASRFWDTRHGRISAFVDVFNAYNRANERAYSYSLTPVTEGVRVRRDVETLLPVIPSAGFSWEF